MSGTYHAGDLVFMAAKRYLILAYLGRSHLGYENYAVLTSKGEVVFYYALAEL